MKYNINLSEDDFIENIIIKYRSGEFKTYTMYESIVVLPEDEYYKLFNFYQNYSDIVDIMRR